MSWLFAMPNSQLDDGVKPLESAQFLARLRKFLRTLVQHLEQHGLR
ncbi:hypothetical protein [Pseudomonas sp. v388]|nr:hypothetical protein [Pseudomonas sp. v388]